MEARRNLVAVFVCTLLTLPSLAAGIEVCNQTSVLILSEPDPVTIDCPTGRVTLYGSTVTLLPGAHISEAIAGPTAGILDSLGGGNTITIEAGIIDTYLNVVSGDVVTVKGYGFTLDGADLTGVIQINAPIGTSGPPAVPELLIGTGENGDPISIPCIFEGDAVLNLEWVGGPSEIEVIVDIKPGSDDNTVNLGSNGVVPVGILSTAEFDATTVDPETVELAGAGVAVRGKGSKLLSSIKDLNGDGLLDLDIKVDTQSLVDIQEDGAAILTGETYDGQAIKGLDFITVVPIPDE